MKQTYFVVEIVCMKPYLVRCIHTDILVFSEITRTHPVTLQNHSRAVALLTQEVCDLSEKQLYTKMGEFKAF